MVGETKFVLEEILNEKQIELILKQSIDEDVSFEFKGAEVKPVMDGLAGFLGDHMKAVLRVDVGGEIKKVHLFVKIIPINNKPKAAFIDEENFFRREMFMYQVVKDICQNDAHPWSVKAYICTDSMIVLPDLTIQGYKPQNFLHTFDLEHVLVSINSIARFHGAFVNYETKKTIELNRPYYTSEEIGPILVDRTYCDSPWLRTSSKLSANLLRKFSAKSYYNIPDLESKLTKLYIEACDSLVEYRNTLNSLIHRDLWTSNIMFKHENDVPINAMIIDYQCIRYGPPAFDLMSFLYLTTDREFRKEHEKKVLECYYNIFTKCLNTDSKDRLKKLAYDKDDFFKWCEKARVFGIFQAIGIYPWILMDSKSAQITFDDPETYEKYVFEDRTEPVVAYCLKCEPYKRRILEVTEEFVDRYLVKNL